jgi:flagellar hook-basal body complex protein FliE
MAIEAIGGISPQIINIGKTEEPDKKLFDNVLTNFISDVNKSQLDSSKLVQDFASGKEVELHDVMIAGEKAKTNLQLLMEIRNKSVDMYNQLTRMQV